MNRPGQLSLEFASPAGDPTGRDLPLPIDSTFDTSFADKMARLELYNKHHYRPNTYLHKWWARRCGSTFRLILKHLVTDPTRRHYYAPGGLEGKIILDPMMGGGTTLHEAIRLGASVVGVDIDPIPVLQARATLADLPLAALETAFAAFCDQMAQALAPLFTTHCPHCQADVPLRYLLYGQRRSCACGPVILVDSLVLRYEAGQPAICLCPACHQVVAANTACTCAPAGLPPLVEKAQTHCPTCSESYREDLAVPFYARYVPLVVVGSCQADGCSRPGLFYAAPTAADLALLAAADEARQKLDFGPAGAFAIASGPKSRDLVSRGVGSYLELFSSRQLLYLAQAAALLPQFPPLVQLNLALLVSTSLEFNSLLCGYKGARRGERPGAIRHTFSYHAYAFPYTALENNPLYPEQASGTLAKLFHDRIRRARAWAQQPRERQLTARRRFTTLHGELDSGVEVAAPAGLQDGPRRFLVRQGSAVALDLPDASVDYIVTDPPYFDSVQYSDLAAFFRVWLARLLPAGADWTYDLAGSAVDPHLNGDGQYTPVLSGIFAECRRVLRPAGGRLIFTFHHWNPKGWAALTLALRRAGFVLLNRYVVHSENPVSVHIANLRSLTHDAILVLAPAGHVPPPDWTRPGRVDQSDSRQFCADCAALLGWLLNSDLAEAAVEATWQAALS